MDYKNLTVPELKAHAEEELGISPPPKITKTELVKLIKEHKGELDLESEIADADREPVKAVILVHDDGDEGQNYYVVGINGRNHKLMKGVDITVPWAVVEALSNAVEDRYKSVTRDNGTRETVKTTVPRIPFSVKKTIYEDE